MKMEMTMTIDRTPLWQTEFPDFAPADMPAIPDGFEDTSWHNDACPSFTNPDTRMVIWVDYAEPAEREHAGPRFALTKVDINQLIEDIAVMTDDWSEIESFISGAAPEGRSDDGCAQVVAEGVQSPEA